MEPGREEPDEDTNREIALQQAPVPLALLLFVGPFVGWHKQRPEPSLARACIFMTDRR
jgi:hypothetical protein